MKKTHNFSTDEKSTGRLDRVIAGFLSDYSRTFLQNLIKSGDVSVNGAVVNQPRFQIKSGMSITINIPEQI